jgi:hypothetical protein
VSTPEILITAILAVLLAALLAAWVGMPGAGDAP